MGTINWNTIERYLKENLVNIPNREMKVSAFSEGYSNLTYHLQIGEWEGVLRRPPFGYTPPKAHDMEREYIILKKMHPVYPLVPEPYIYCEDSSIMDKHFYVMEKKNGIVIDEKLPAHFVGEEKAVSRAVVSALTELHNIDYKSCGMDQIGKPEGYISRQVHGWIKRYEASKTHSINHVKEIEDWLKANIVINEEVAIIHNDFKLNNMMFAENNPSKVIGVFDWELATIGDPLSDLGSTLVYWSEQNDPEMGISAATRQSGFYTRREFLENYAKASGRDVSNIHFYLVFGFYKLAVILQQIYHRWHIGELKEDRFKELDKGIANLMELAHLAKGNVLI